MRGPGVRSVPGISKKQSALHPSDFRCCGVAALLDADRASALDIAMQTIGKLFTV